MKNSALSMRRRWSARGVVHRILVAAAVLLTALAGVSVASGPAQAATSLPCDIYAAGGTPCVTAHSTVRALFVSYAGPLYQVQRKSDGALTDIGLTSAGGFANAAEQTSFCSGTTCTITKIYDQTANHNDLPISSGGFWPGPGPGGSDIGANAMALPVTVAGHPAFGVNVTPGVGYRVDNARNVPTGSQPEGIYMVTSSNSVGQFCCFDYGSGETSHTDTGNATMNAIEWGTACWFGGCTRTGPWVEADLENGMYSTNTGPNNASNPGVHFPFVTAMEKNNGVSNFTLKDGNASSGGLTTTWSGPLPNGYSPMKLQPSILLGTGGDNSVNAPGQFFEGAVTAGFVDATENAVQANLVTAGYSGSSAGSSTGALHAVGASRSLDVPNSSTTAGTQVQIWSCSGATNQTFTHTASNQLTVYNGADCLDANNSGTTAGTKVIIWPCNGQVNQQWTINSNGTITGTQSGLCLDVSGASTANGALVQLWTCNGGSNQQWALR